MRSCPKCKSSEYNNKTFVLMINECGHSLCKKCVDNLFVRQSAPCPTCGRTLKAKAFWEQTFDDPLVAKEVYIRKKLQKIFNLKEDDFPNLRAYNDYLEQIETYVFNLTNEVDVDETKALVDEFQRQHEDIIAKNKNRRSKDDEWIQKMLTEEESQRRAHIEAENSLAPEEKVEKKGEEEMRALMAEFMSSDTPAEFIVNDKKRQQYLADQEKQKAEKTQSRPKQHLDHKQQIVPLGALSEGEPYVYEPMLMELNGPPVPSIDELGSRGFLKHIRAAATWQLAGGYHESLGCYRALIDAHCDLFG